MCPATPRDLLKPYAERLAETALAAQEQTGMPNGQQPIYGLEIERVNSNKAFKVTVGEAFYDGVSLPLKTVLSAETAVATGAKLEAGQKCMVLIEIDKPASQGATPTVVQTVSAITGGTPVLPELTAGRLAVAYLLLEGAFTPGTTAIPAEPEHESEAGIHPIKYSAGNIAPKEGY